MHLTVVLASATLLSACSRNSRPTREEVRSDLRQALSLAAETEMFVNYIQEGRSTANYTAGHAAYLRTAVMQLIRELKPGNSDASTNTIEQCKSELEQLNTELWRIPKESRDSNALEASAQSVRSIHDRLAKTRAQL